MKKLILSAILASLPAAVFAQSAPSDKVKLEVTRADLQVIGQGLMELPYKTSAGVLNSLQVQLNAANQAAAAEAAKTAADSAKPADGNPDKGAGPAVPAAKSDQNQ